MSNEKYPCKRCGTLVDVLCSKCRDEIRGVKWEKPKGLIPLLYYDTENRVYVFACTVRSCPCNRDGLCTTTFTHLPVHLLHEFDGDNIIKQVCG